MKLLPFHNPYEKLPKTDKCRLTTDISKVDWTYLKCIRPTVHVPGTFNTFANLLISKCLYELRKRGITDLTHANEFEHFVANCQIVGPEQTILQPSDIIAIRVSDKIAGVDDAATSRDVGSADARNDRRGTSSQSGGDSTTTNVQPDVQSSVAKARKRKKRQLPDGIVDATEESIKRVE